MLKLQFHYWIHVQEQICISAILDQFCERVCAPCLTGCGCRCIIEWCPGSCQYPSFFHLPILPHRPVPSSSLSPPPYISATTALSTIWSPEHLSPHPFSSSLSVCRSPPLPSRLYPWPWLVAVSRHQGQISLSLPSSLPPSLAFLFSPSIDATFPALGHCAQISVSACLATFIFFSFPPLDLVKCMSWMKSNHCVRGHCSGDTVLIEKLLHSEELLLKLMCSLTIFIWNSFTLWLNPEFCIEWY